MTLTSHDGTVYHGGWVGDTSGGVRHGRGSVTSTDGNVIMCALRTPIAPCSSSPLSVVRCLSVLLTVRRAGGRGLAKD